jgi:hypothetical protein
MLHLGGVWSNDLVDMEQIERFDSFQIENPRVTRLALRH